jgi:hypothetical protein
MKDNTKLDCILVTDETKVIIPKNMSEWDKNVLFLQGNRDLECFVIILDFQVGRLLC